MQTDSASNRTPTWLKCLVALGVLVAAAPVALVFALPHITTYLDAKKIARQHPELWSTPVPIPDTSIAIAKGQPYTYAGVTFSAPWDSPSPDPVPADMGSEAAALTFDSKYKVILFNQPIANRGGAKPWELYESDRAIFDATPAMIRFWSSPQTLNLASARLVEKELKMSAINVRQLFNIDAPHFRGFQFGSVANPRATVQLYLYGNLHAIHVLVGWSQRDRTAATQADINLIVQTLRDAK